MRYIHFLTFFCLSIFISMCTKPQDDHSKNQKKSKNQSNPQIQSQQYPSKKNQTLKKKVETKKSFVLIKTNKGNIKAEIFPHLVPRTIKNFVDLIKKNFYTNLIFHRVVPKFVIQTGDPNGDGTGGSDKSIPLEIPCKNSSMVVGQIAPQKCDPALTHRKGALGMARSSEPNSASSQFYITLNQTPHLNRSYAVFGYVIQGYDVINKIEIGDTLISISLINSDQD